MPAAGSGQSGGAADSPSGAADSSSPADTPLTPDQVAQKVLADVTPSTTVTVASPVYVAGRPTYELVVAPKAAQSTVQDVTIAIDSNTGVPLRVQVTPRRQTRVVPWLHLRGLLGTGSQQLCRSRWRVDGDQDHRWNRC